MTLIAEDVSIWFSSNGQENAALSSVVELCALSVA
jgi:hypothetical protein